MAAQRAEGLDVAGAAGPLGDLPGPDRPRGAQAQGHQLLPGRHAQRRRRGPPAARGQRRLPVQRGLPRPTSSSPTGCSSARRATAGGWPAPRSATSGSRSPAAGAASGDAADYLPVPVSASGEAPAEAAGRVRRAHRRRAGLRRPAAAPLLRQIAGGARRAGRGRKRASSRSSTPGTPPSRRVVLGWRGADAAAFGARRGDAAQPYLSLPPTLIGGGTLEIQLNVIAERVLGLPR